MVWNKKTENDLLCAADIPLIFQFMNNEEEHSYVKSKCLCGFSVGKKIESLDEKEPSKGNWDKWEAK